MKSCTYCGRENNDGVMSCQGCGTPFPFALGELSDTSRNSRSTPKLPNQVVAGLAVVLIYSGAVLASKEAFPEIYGFGLLLVPWLFVLAIAASALSLYAATLCCRTQWCRVAFTFAIMAVLALEGWVLLVEESGAGGQISSLTVYGGSALLIIAGAITLAWSSRQRVSIRRRAFKGLHRMAVPLRSLATLVLAWRKRHGDRD